MAKRKQKASRSRRRAPRVSDADSPTPPRPAPAATPSLRARLGLLLARWQPRQAGPLSAQQSATERATLAREAVAVEIARTIERLNELASDFQETVAAIEADTRRTRRSKVTFTGDWDEAIARATKAVDIPVRRARDGREVERGSRTGWEPDRPDAREIVLPAVDALLSDLDAQHRDVAEQMDREAALARDWRRGAERAVLAGDDDLALDALRRAREHEHLAAAYGREATTMARIVAEVRAALDELEVNP
jgi:hypothetical protein